MGKSIKKNVLISVICVFFAVILLFVGVIVPKLSGTKFDIPPTEIETTVVAVEQKDKDYLITVEEYNCKLFVDFETIIDKETINDLNPGEKIFFRIIDLDENLLANPQIEQIFIVTLRTETQDIVTLESYQESEMQGLTTIRNVCIIASSILVMITVFNILKIANKSRKNL